MLTNCFWNARKRFYTLLQTYDIRIKRLTNCIGKCWMLLITYYKANRYEEAAVISRLSIPAGQDRTGSVRLAKSLFLRMTTQPPPPITSLDIIF